MVKIIWVSNIQQIVAIKIEYRINKNLIKISRSFKIQINYQIITDYNIMQGLMKRNPLDYHDELLMNMGEMGKRSWDIKKVLNPREQKMASELKQLAGLQKRRRPNKNKSKQRKLAEKYYSSIF